ncbi:MAG: neutral/alkaline non-lysosomal ceramidase N-terminal domain-containing protein [Clostridia bacterium]|nr:neutral/alkaline non-lysosomal ceramidase N-terminal domain-containing protein [Clostridia bacterium]
MKKILCALLALSLLLPLCACSSSLEKAETKSAETAEQTETEKEKETKIPEGFSTGFARADVSPYGYSVRMNSTSTANTVKDPIFATCVAVSDGKQIALLFSLDIRNTTKAEQMLSVVSKATGIPKENMFFTATHNHSGPDPTASTSDVTHWYTDFYKALVQAAKDAIADLTPSEIYIGKANSPAGTNFVRRYQRADGSWDGIHNANTSKEPVTAYESEADKELRTVRFERGQEKDIVMVNWQAHAAHALTSNNSVITADFITNFRKGVEKEADCHFAYYQGAAGDINFSSHMNDKKYDGWEEIGSVLVDVVKEALESETPAASGKLQITKSVLDGVVRKETEERVKQAKEINKAGTDEKKSALMTQYGFASRYEVSAVIKRSEMENTSPLPLYCISFGDVAFASAPFEMFNTNGVELRTASPYPMTFNCSYTNGACGYMPSSVAFDHGGYEVHTCYFEKGTGERCVEESVRILKEHFSNR